jgi:starch phosphorylase
VREYTEQHYLPAAASYRVRAKDKGTMGENLVKWQHTLEQKWASLRFGELKIETNMHQHIFEVKVFLNDLDLNAVRVELYADGIKDSSPVRQEMKCIKQPTDTDICYVFSIQIPATRPVTDYTVRVIPNYNNVAVPLEANQILWLR